MNVPSADISEFIILTQFDLSGPTPKVCLDPASVGVNEAQVKYIYTILTPSGVEIYAGDSTFASPDSVGNGDVFCVNLPIFNGTIEWSGSDWTIIATMQDTNLEEWSQTIQAQVCPPRGNNVAGTWYGQSCLAPQVKCDSAEILLSDCTNYNYKGLDKTIVSKVMTLIFPADPDTGVQPTPVVVSGLNDAAIRIDFNGNYEARLVTIYDYDAGNGVTITIRYTTYHKSTGVHLPITVECYINVCPLLCEWEALREEVKSLCGVDDVAYTKKKRILDEITTLIVDVLVRKECGKPVGELIGEIKKISGFTCNCDCDNNGVVARALIPASAPSYVFDVITTCGDVTGVFSNPSGNNILLTLSGKTYVVAIGAGMSANGWTLTPTLVGCVKTYTLNLNLNTLVTNILTEIDGNVTLKSAFCAIVAQCDPNSPFAGVDMLCVAPTLNNQCDYFAELLAGQAFPNDKFVGIEINGLLYSPPIEYLYTNDTQINLWLATLAFGFAGTEYVNSAGTIDFTALANVNSITRLRFKRGFGPHTPYDVYVTVSNCVSTPGTTEKMQALITFLCQLNTALFGPDPALYKVKVGSDADTTPDYIDNKVQSDDSSVQISVIGEKVNFRTIQKVSAGDNCAGYLVDKIISNYFDVTVQNVNVYAYDYVATSTVYGAGKNIFSININGTDYPLNVLSTDLSAIEAAINAIGLGTFTATSPASNLVITSLGNRYVVASITMVLLSGPTYTTFNAVQSNPQSLGTCAVLVINPKARTWTTLAVNARYDPVTAVCEYSSLDSLRNVMMNINLVFDPAVVAGTYSVNAVPIPVELRPRTDQKILVKGGWDGISINLFNYIIIHDTGFIEIEYNNPMSAEALRMDSIYYPTN